MSAIWGIIDLTKNSIPEEKASKFESSYSCYKIDRISNITLGNACMGAGIQFITKESESEKLPYYDSDNHNLFTADAYLDNRSELLEILNQNDDTPDGMLIYLAYLKWGLKVCDHLLGVFSFAIYNYESNHFHLFVDHCGDRCVHYYHNKNIIIFSTIIKPILETENHNIAISEKYIAACESNISADMVVFHGLSPFEGIYQLLSGQYMTASLDDKGHIKTELTSYWNPVRDVKPLKLSTDLEYKKIFLETYDKCVKDTLRVNGKAGAFLSSGLDSTSVAALAATNLEKSGHKLYTYTSVPLKDYKPEDGNRLENETGPVLQFCEVYNNIEPKFIQCEEKSALSEMERFVDLFCAPIKYSVNAVWMDEIYKTAASDGCKLLLTGQHGNSSVSSGSLIARLWFDFKAMRFITMIKQYRTFTHNFNVNRSLFIKDVFSNLFSYIHPTLSFVNCLTKDDLFKKYGLKKAYLSKSKSLGSSQIYSELQRRNTIFMPSSFQQVSYANALFELSHGIISRDPTRDKRMIELCMAMPIKCFCDGKYERRLITYYMKDMIPQHIIRQMYKRGLQSADFSFRLKKYHVDYRQLFDDNKEKLERYINPEDLSFDENDTIKNIISLNEISLLLFLLNNNRDK